MVVQISGFEEVIPQSDLDLLSAGREAEYLQPLMDLGYLKSAQDDLHPALYQFRKEYLVYNLIPEYSIKILDWPPGGEPETVELELLHRLVSLESDLDLPEDLVIGNQNIWTRVMLYRFELYGLYFGDVGAPLNESIIQQFGFLENWLGITLTIAEWAEWMGDFNRFAALVFQKGNLQNRIVAFEYANPQLDADLEDEIGEEEPDDDQEENLILEEKNLENEIDGIANLVSSQEEIQIGKLEKRNQPKREKVDRVRKLMQKTLDEMSGLLKESLLKVEAFEKEKDDLKLNIEGLKNLNQQRDLQIAQLKEKLKTETDKELKKKWKNAIESFEIGNEGTERDIEELEESIAGVESKIRQEESNRQQNMSERQLILLDKQKQLRAIEKRIDGLNFRFKAKLKRALSDDFYKKIKTEVFEKRNRDFLAKTVADPVNTFLIRMVQLHQWTNGYYFGKLDADFKKRTFDSVAELCEDMDDLRLKYVLTKLGDLTSGYWILNIRYFFEKIMEAEARDNFSGDAADLFEKFQERAGEKAFSSEVISDAWKDYNEEIKNGLEQPGLLRRVYFGLKILVRSVFRCFEKLIQFILKGIRRFLTIFKNFIKLLYKEIREAVLQFSDGMAFLFSKREFVTADQNGNVMVFTDMDFDFDATVSLHPDSSPAQLRTHGIALRKRAQNLNFSLVITGKIIKWAMRLSQPISWPTLALQAAIFLRKYLKEWWRRKKRKPAVT